MQKLKVKDAERIEDQIHQYLKNSSEARFIHRLHGVLLLISSEDNNCANVGSLFKNSPRSLSNWIHEINASGDIEARPIVAKGDPEKKEQAKKHPENSMFRGVRGVF